ncbi:unnamed protein product [Tenebrio molitor]|nr:unnamed protein product [Tenebrio molitor]
MAADNELTHVRTKNLSGNVKLTTLEVLSTNTPLDKLINKEFENEQKDISDETTNEVVTSTGNKQDEIQTITENQHKVVLLSEDRTKASTDGVGPFGLMDVFNSTSGTLPDQASTEKVIAVTPLHFQLIHDSDLAETVEVTLSDISTRPNEITTVHEEFGIASQIRDGVSDDDEVFTSTTSASEFQELSTDFTTTKTVPLALSTQQIQMSTVRNQNYGEADTSSTHQPSVTSTFRLGPSYQYEGTDSVYDDAFTVSSNGDKFDNKESVSVSTENIIIENFELEMNGLFNEPNRLVKENAASAVILTQIADSSGVVDASEELTQDHDDIEDLSSFINVDEEFLGAVLDENTNSRELEETIEDVSSILTRLEEGSNFRSTTENGLAKQEEVNDRLEFFERMNEITTVFDKIGTEASTVSEVEEYYTVSTYRYVAETTTEMTNVMESFTSKPTQQVEENLFSEKTDEFVENQDNTIDSTTVKISDYESTEMFMKENRTRNFGGEGINQEFNEESGVFNNEDSISTTEIETSFVNEDLENTNLLNEETTNNPNKLSVVKEEDHLDEGHIESGIITESEGEVEKNVFRDNYEVYTTTIMLPTTKREIKIVRWEKQDEDINEEMETTATYFVGVENEFVVSTTERYDNEMNSKEADFTTVSTFSKDDKDLPESQQELNYEKFVTKTTINPERTETEVNSYEAVSTTPSPCFMDNTDSSNSQQELSSGKYPATTTNPETTDTDLKSYSATDNSVTSVNSVRKEFKMLSSHDFKNSEVKESHISTKIDAKNISFTIKIVYNKTSFFVPSDAFLTNAPPDAVNITWKSSIPNINNSIELKMGKSVQLNIVKGAQMHIHKTALIPETENKLNDVDTKLITLDDGVKIYFSNTKFFAPDHGDKARFQAALTAEIIGGCLGTSVITGILVYWAIKKFKGNTRNFKPNSSDPA